MNGWTKKREEGPTDGSTKMGSKSCMRLQQSQIGQVAQTSFLRHNPKEQIKETNETNMESGKKELLTHIFI